jgi:hypothetical protein
MKNLTDLESPDVLEAFLEESVVKARQMAGIATAEKGFGGNSGVPESSGNKDTNVDAWFAEAGW